LEFAESEHHIGFVVLFLSLTLQDRLGCEFGRIQVLEERFQVFNNVTLFCGHLMLDTPLWFYLTPRVARISCHQQGYDAKATGSISLGSLSRTLPPRALTGQYVISSVG
jgi:hypothetical protein